MTTTDAAPQPEQQELDQLLDSLLTEFDDAKPLSKLTTDNSASERDLNKEEKPATIDDALVQDMMAGMEELMRAMETSPELRSQMESCLADFSAVDAPKSSATTTTAAATTVPTSPNDLAAELAKIIGEMSKMECGSSSSDANVAEQQTRSASPLPAQPAKTYQETVKETMERLQNSSQKVEV
jgi:hypothetical protein